MASTTKTYTLVADIILNPKRLITEPSLILKEWEVKWLQLNMVPRQTLFRQIKRLNSRSDARAVDAALRLLQGDGRIDATIEGGVELYFPKTHVPPNSAILERREHDGIHADVLLAAVSVLRKRAKHEPQAQSMLNRIAEEIERYNQNVVIRRPE